MSRQKIKDLQKEFDAKSESLRAAFKAGELTHSAYRKQADQLEAKLSRDVAEQRGQKRFWNCTTYQWEPLE